MRGEALFRVALEKLEQARPRRRPRRRSTGCSRSRPTTARGASPARGVLPRAGRRSWRASSTTPRRATRRSSPSSRSRYYMLLAYARLRALDDRRARATPSRAAVAREPAGPSRHERITPSSASPAFDRFAAPARGGRGRRRAPRGRRRRSGRPRASDPEVLWTIAWLYDRAGAPELGHSFARGRLADFRAHWPAGRWRLAWQVAFPRAWDAVVTRESASAGIPRR